MTKKEISYRQLPKVNSSRWPLTGRSKKIIGFFFKEEQGKEERVPDDVIERVREQERARWEKRDAHHYGSPRQKQKKEARK